MFFFFSVCQSRDTRSLVGDGNAGDNVSARSFFVYNKRTISISLGLFNLNGVVIITSSQRRRRANGKCLYQRNKVIKIFRLHIFSFSVRLKDFVLQLTLISHWNTHKKIKFFTCREKRLKFGNSIRHVQHLLNWMINCILLI